MTINLFEKRLMGGKSRNNMGSIFLVDPSMVTVSISLIRTRLLENKRYQKTLTSLTLCPTSPRKEDWTKIGGRARFAVQRRATHDRSRGMALLADSDLDIPAMCFEEYEAIF